MQIVGVGFQSPSANAAWIEDQSYQYEVWQDVNRDLATYYGAKNGLLDMPDRVTMLLDPDGTLRLEYRSVSTGAHPGQVLSDCKALYGDGDNAAP